MNYNLHSTLHGEIKSLNEAYIIIQILCLFKIPLIA